MLHYSSQFCNELYQRDDITLKVAIASYYDEKLYREEIGFIKIRSKPNLLNFIFDSLNIFYHVYFWVRVLLFRPNIVHFIDNHPWYGLHARILQLFWVQIYVTQHDPTLHSWESRSLMWKVAGYTNSILRKKSDKLIVHGDVLKAEVVKMKWVEASKVISIPHGAYTFFSEYSQWFAVQNNTFLFFGRIVDYKWLDVLLESLQYVKKYQNDFTLIIVGPWDTSKYEKQLKKYKENIKLFNFDIPAHEIYKYFEISEFVVLPYYDATGSGVIPVAYCFKKAVIVSDVGELPSVVREWKTWYIVWANNPEVLSQKIIDMLKQKDKTRDMWKKGYDFSVKHLSWKPIVSKIYGSE